VSSVVSELDLNNDVKQLVECASQLHHRLDVRYEPNTSHFGTQHRHHYVSHSFMRALADMGNATILTGG